MVPVPCFVNRFVIWLKAHYQEIDKDVKHEEQLYEDDEGPVNGDHIEGELDEQERGRKSGQQVPHYLVVIAYVDEELARLDYSHPEGESEEHTAAKDAAVDGDEPLPEMPRLLQLLIFLSFDRTSTFFLDHNSFLV